MAFADTSATLIGKNRHGRQRDEVHNGQTVIGGYYVEPPKEGRYPSFRPRSRVVARASMESANRRILWIWGLLSCLAVGICSLIWSAAHLGFEYLPVGNDSFYHARRILDTAADPSSFYEFDPKIHAPEGSLLTWPWAYDYALGWIVRAGLAIGATSDPMAILVWIPTASVLVAMGLIVVLARRLSLSLWSTTLAGLCFALLPLTQYLYGVGFVDHHFAEHLLVLAALCAGMSWLAEPGSTSRAVITGIVLGGAPAIHNGLFVLQIPLLAVLLIWWMCGAHVPRSQATRFSIALIVTSVAILAPSLAFRMGRFEYYTLSWFHLYVALCTGILASLLSRTKVSLSSGALLVVAGVLMLLPIGTQIVAGQAFLVGSITRLDAIAEMKSLVEMYRSYGPLDISNRYSLLIWLVPLNLIFCAISLWEERRSERALFWVSAIFGLALLCMQFRLHYFGSFALFFPLLIAVERLVSRVAAQRKSIMLTVSLCLLLAFSYPMRNTLLGPMTKANDVYFENLRPLLKILADACKEEPGVVLADNDAGHYIRFYTECSVITNNFLITPQHEAKIREFELLMSLAAPELPKAAPYVRYVLARPVDIRANDDGSYTYISFSPKSSRLIGDLLLQPFSSTPAEPSEPFELLGQTRLKNLGDIPYARLYKVRAARQQSKEIGDS